MKLLVLIILIGVFHSATPAALVSCPKFCKCEFDEGSVYAKCISQKFLTKIDDKQANTIERLDLSNASITSLDKRLKKLKNLKYLDVSNNELQNLQHLTNLQNLMTLTVSNNKLETVPVSVLPKNIRDLDISHNSISDLPKDISSLHNLKTLHLQGNPVNCDETAINRYVNLVTLKVNITEHVECYSPKDVNGKRLQTLIADSLLNPMLGDQEETSEMEEDPDNSEFIKHSTEKPEKLEKPPQEDDLFEGSGEEGSGNYEKEDPSACIIDCSTFKPLEIMKENNTSPLLSIKEQVGILFEDLFGKEQDPTTVAPTAPVEEVATKKIVHEVSATKTTMKQTEKLIVAAKESKTSEDPNKAAFDEGLTYYLIGTVIVLMVVVAIFIIVKKRVSQGKSRRRRNSMTENGICEEMKPLGKYREISNGTNNEQQKEDNVRPERIPLINGQNGKTDLPKDSMEELDITMRSADNEDGASPKPERVTIKSSEIPPSVLKTPQLVHREINSDGEIVTKPLDDSY